MSYLESVPVVAGADLSTMQYKAVAVGGTIAANNGAALGILQNKPKQNQDATVGIAGRSRYVAGAAVTAGNRICVTTSGFMIAVASNQLGCGTALATVSSGGIGEGYFNFAGVRTSVTSANLA